MDITDYIYVDHQRVNSYFEQISPPVYYDKVPVWKVALGLAGPSAEGTQQRPSSPYTDHEKIVELFTHLPRCKDTDGQKPFQVLTCFAQRTVIPGVKETGLPGVALWMCRNVWTKGPPPDEEIDGYLIEAPQYDEDAPLHRYSGVTAISLLLDELSRSAPNRQAKTSLVEKLGTVLVKQLKTVSSDAVYRLEPERKIDCLVRLRLRSAWGYIGYPVFIAQHPSQFHESQSKGSLTWNPGVKE